MTTTNYRRGRRAVHVRAVDTSTWSRRPSEFYTTARDGAIYIGSVYIGKVYGGPVHGWRAVPVDDEQLTVTGFRAEHEAAEFLWRRAANVGTLRHRPTTEEAICHE